jgi:hypothetical protein
MNGTSKSALLDQYKKCLKALRELDAAMGEATPHGRDYQTHSNPDASIEARKAWGQRRIWLDHLKDDLNHSAEMIYGQDGEAEPYNPNPVTAIR